MHIVKKKDDYSDEFLQRQGEFLQILINAIPVPIFYKDEKGIYIGCNSAFEEYLGMPREKLIGKSVHDISPKELAVVYEEADRRLLEQGGKQSYESSVVNHMGLTQDVVFNKSPFYDSEGQVGGLVGTIFDITERKKIERKQHDSQILFQSIFKNTAVSMAILNVDGDLLKVNPALCKFLGYQEEEELLRLGVADITDAEYEAETAHWYNEIKLGNRLEFSYEKKYMHKDGSAVWGHATVSVLVNVDCDTICCVALIQDITKRKNAEKEIQQMAYHDLLTGLPNRVLFRDRLTSAITDADSAGNNVGVLFVDLDNFKKVNDTMGHAVGDLLLKAVASRLQSSVR